MRAGEVAAAVHTCRCLLCWGVCVSAFPDQLCKVFPLMQTTLVYFSYMNINLHVIHLNLSFHQVGMLPKVFIWPRNMESNSWHIVQRRTLLISHWMGHMLECVLSRGHPEKRLYMKINSQQQLAQCTTRWRRLFVLLAVVSCRAHTFRGVARRAPQKHTPACAPFNAKPIKLFFDAMCHELLSIFLNP